MTAQLDKLEEIVGVVNSSGAAYEQVGTKFEKLHDGVAVLRTRLDDANLAENDTGKLRPGVERAYHDETHDAKGGAMRIADSNCYEIHTEMEA